MLQDYLLYLSQPLNYYRVNKETVDSKIKYFTTMFEYRISAEMAILMMNTEIEDLINNN